MKSFGERVKELRQKRDWTQQELAKYARVPHMTIWRIERDAHKYTRMDIAVKLARAFGVSLDLLCGLYEDDPNSESLPTALAFAGGTA
jgi:transcriptional regulator with XRE-family HTH domain